MTDTELKMNGLDVLTEKLGLVEAERFISLILREPFDYTVWRGELFDGMPVEELNRKAMEFQEGQKATGDTKEIG